MKSRQASENYTPMLAELLYWEPLFVYYSLYSHSILCFMAITHFSILKVHQHGIMLVKKLSILELQGWSCKRIIMVVSDKWRCFDLKK